MNTKKVTFNQVWRKYNTLTVNNIKFIVINLSPRLMKEIWKTNSVFMTKNTALAGVGPVNCHFEIYQLAPFGHRMF